MCLLYLACRLIYCAALVDAYAGEKLACLLACPILLPFSQLYPTTTNININSHPPSASCPGAMRNRLHKKEFSIHKDAVNGTYVRIPHKGCSAQIESTYLSTNIQLHLLMLPHL